MRSIFGKPLALPPVSSGLLPRPAFSGRCYSLPSNGSLCRLQVKALQQQVHNGQQELQEEVQQLREASAGQATSVASLQHQHQQEREAWERDMRQLRAELERKAAAHPLSAELPGARGGGEEQAGAPEVEHLLAEIERLRQERADAEAQADELASSLAAERRRSEQVGLPWSAPVAFVPSSSHRPHC